MRGLQQLRYPEMCLEFWDRRKRPPVTQRLEQLCFLQFGFLRHLPLNTKGGVTR